MILWLLYCIIVSIRRFYDSTELHKLSSPTFSSLLLLTFRHISTIYFVIYSSIPSTLVQEFQRLAHSVSWWLLLLLFRLEMLLHSPHFGEKLNERNCRRYVPPAMIFSVLISYANSRANKTTIHIKSRAHTQTHTHPRDVPRKKRKVFISLTAFYAEIDVELWVNKIWKWDLKNTFSSQTSKSYRFTETIGHCLYHQHNHFISLS